MSVDNGSSRPSSFLFSIGGFDGPHTRFHLENDGLHIRYSKRGPVSLEPDVDQIVQPTSNGWKSFWATADNAGLWSWDREYYDNSDILDGTQWNLELKLRGRTVNTGGSNAYPDSQGSSSMERTEAFNTFLSALRELGHPATVDVYL